MLLLACTILLGNVIEWDQPAGVCSGSGPAAPVGYYQVERQTVSTGTTAIVGTTATEPEPAALWWDTSQDEPLPREGTAYRYRVSEFSLIGDAPVSCGPSAWVDACGPPMACFDATGEVQCYPGAPLRTR
jgi:hypothetical protein